MNNFCYTNSTSGAQRPNILLTSNKYSTLRINSIFLSKDYYTSNSADILCVCSKSLARNSNIQDSSLLPDFLFSFGVNGLTTENVVLTNFNYKIVFNNPTVFVNVDDFVLRDIDGNLIDLTTDSVRLAINFTLY